MRKVLAIVLALGLVVGLMAPAALAADEVEKTVDTVAIVGGTGSPPFICAKFETPDDDAIASGTQIRPVAGAAKVVKFYVIAGDPNGPQDVAAIDVTVRYPDGTEKFQLRAVRVSDGGTPLDVRDDAWQDPATGNTLRNIIWDQMIDMDGDCAGDTPISVALPDLLAQGRLTLGVNQTITGVLYDLEHAKQILIELVGEMDYHQPSCDYTVEAMATDIGSDTGAILSNTFFYMSIVALRIDFEATGISFDTVNPCQWNYRLGDADMGTPLRPTVQNIGNDPAMLELHATAMVGDTHGKTIEEFDAEMDCLNPDTGAIVQEGRIEFSACTPTVITEIGDPTIPVLLRPCTPTQIDFSVHPPMGTLEDTYRGQMTIKILHFVSPLP
jgi:hypothetical protein